MRSVTIVQCRNKLTVPCANTGVQSKLLLLVCIFSLVSDRIKGSGDGVIMA